MFCDQSGGGEHCLICHQLIPHSPKSSPEINSENDETRRWSGCSLLERHLEVIFLLRKVLQVPVRHLARFLEGSSNVEGWISICNECRKLVEECKSVYHQFLEVNSKWLECKSRIVGLIRETGGKEEEDEVVDLEVIDIGKCTRQFVQSYSYKAWRNPYLDGDLKAKELVNLVNKVEIKVEDEVKEEEPEIYVLPDFYDESVPSNCPSLAETDTGLDGDDLIIQSVQEEATTATLPSNTSKKIVRTIRKKQVASQRKRNTHKSVPSNCPSVQEVDSESEEGDLKSGHDDEAPVISKKVVKRRKKNSGTPPRPPGRQRKLNPEDKDQVEKLENLACQNGIQKGPRNGTWKSPVTCPVCALPLRQKGYLRAHLSTAHSIGSLNFRCDKCQKSFHNNHKLQRHSRVCGTPLGRPRPRTNPSSDSIKLQDTEFRIQCPVNNCSLQFTMTNCHAYRNHRRDDHSKEEKESLEKYPKYLECLQCGIMLSTKSKAKRHLDEVHNNSLVASRKAVCEFCGLAFYKTYWLNHHKNTSLSCRKLQGLSESEATVVCELCGKRYAHKLTLQRHIQYRHEGKLIDLVCPEKGCGKIFHDKPGLKRHRMGVHKVDGEPRFTCRECGKAFYTSQSRSRHFSGVHKGWYKTHWKKEKVKVKNDSGN